MSIGMASGRYRVLHAAALFIGMVGGSQAIAQTMSIINPYSGGSNELMSRTLAEQFRQEFNMNVIVENREGGSGVVGVKALVRAAPDGRNLVFTPLTPIVVQPHLIKNLGLMPADVQPVCGVTENILGVAVVEDSPFRSVQDLVATARKRSVSFGSPGPNSMPFLGVNELAHKNRIELNHIPYKGDAPSLQDLIGGRLDFSAIVAASGAGLIEGRKVRLLAVMSEQRHPGYPSVPTLKEAGFDVVRNSFAGLFAPKGVSEQQLARLDAACGTATKSAAVRQAAERSHLVVVYRDRASWTRMVNDEYQRSGDALREFGVRE
jgi:tripartite-type tricarboxylate transporter receptor subunit TctC